MKQKEVFDSFRGLVDVAQLGLSVVAPIVLCAMLAVWLKKKFGLYDIFVVIIILLGVASGIYAAVCFAKDYLKRINRQEKNKDERRKL